MPIERRFVEFIQGPAFIQAGTRDERLQPAHTWAVGAVANADSGTVTFFVAQSCSGRILSDLENNGRIALFVSVPGTHESYQFKGRYLSHRPTDEADVAVQVRYRSRLVAKSVEAGYPEELARPMVLGFAYTPGVAITFQVEEVFLQTPGPDAGKRIG